MMETWSYEYMLKTMYFVLWIVAGYIESIIFSGFVSSPIRHSSLVGQSESTLFLAQYLGLLLPESKLPLGVWNAATELKSGIEYIKKYW